MVTGLEMVSRLKKHRHLIRESQHRQISVSSKAEME